MLNLGDLYWFCKGCGVRLGFYPFHGHEVGSPRWHQRSKNDFLYPYCATCFKGFAVRHLGFGTSVRPREESDVPIGGPGLKELYS